MFMFELFATDVPNTCFYLLPRSALGFRANKPRKLGVGCNSQHHPYFCLLFCGRGGNSGTWRKSCVFIIGGPSGYCLGRRSIAIGARFMFEINIFRGSRDVYIREKGAKASFGTRYWNSITVSLVLSRSLHLKHGEVKPSSQRRTNPKVESEPIP